ncbi:MAG: hypothetical protein FWB80_01710 [Defluviitaleaceae bacterium]|nr:hypothetical protein [Defluviitaleaceae bacterium]
MVKKIVTVVLALALVVSLSATAYAGNQGGSGTVIHPWSAPICQIDE